MFLSGVGSVRGLNNVVSHLICQTQKEMSANERLIEIYEKQGNSKELWERCRHAVPSRADLSNDVLSRVGWSCHY